MSDSMYLTGNPVPSADPRDRWDNGISLDEFVSGGLEAITTRTGKSIYTLAYLNRMLTQAKGQIDSAVSGVNTEAAKAKADMQATAAALGNDLNNKKFSTYALMLKAPQTRDGVVAVVDADPDANLNGWYSWDNTGKKWVRFLDQPAMSSVLNLRVPSISAPSVKMLPLIISGKKVVLWLDEGRVDGANLRETVISAARKLIPEIQPNKGAVPLMTNDYGQVIAWIREGRFEAAGLTPVEKVVTRTKNASPLSVPLITNDSGQVIAWIREGTFDAVGLKQAVSLAAQAAIDAQAAKNPIKVTDGSSLYAYRAKIAKALGGSGSARVIFTGDSWTEHLNETAQPLASALYKAYGQAGTGWVGMDADEGGATSTKSQLLNSARLVKSGFTLLDMSPTECNSLDGHAATATGTAATIKITNLKTQSLTWYYKDGDGTFRYSVDGGEPVSVVGGGTGLRKSVEISGLSDEPHAITFDLVGNTGTVTIYGGMALRSSVGVEFSKAGNGGSTAVQWQGLAPFVQAYSSELKPDAVFIILGTNDLNQNIGKAAFKAGLQSMVDAYKAGSPHCAIVLVTPTRGYSTLDLGLMASYAEAMLEISKATANVEFINLNSFMPPRIVTNDMGLWADNAHLSENGGRFVTGLLMKNFLLTN